MIHWPAVCTQTYVNLFTLCRCDWSLWGQSLRRLQGELNLSYPKVLKTSLYIFSCHSWVLSRFSRPLPAPLSLPLLLRRLLLPSFASTNLQSLILLPPHIFLPPPLDVCNPLILFISHAFGFLSFFLRYHCLLLTPFPTLAFFLPLFSLTTQHPSLLLSNHCYPPQSVIIQSLLPCPPPPHSVSFSSACDLSSPLQLFSSRLLSPSFYLSVKHNLSSHSFIVAILRSSPDLSVLVHMPSESDITWLDVYRLSTGITALLMFLLGVINASVPGSLGQYLLNYSGSDIAI